MSAARPYTWRRLVYTAHSRRRMRERGVDEAMVEEALREPIQVLYDRRRDVYLVLGGNNVAVVLADRISFAEIVTVMRRREYEALVKRLGRKRYRLIL